MSSDGGKTLAHVSSSLFISYVCYVCTFVSYVSHVLYVCLLCCLKRTGNLYLYEHFVTLSFV